MVREQRRGTQAGEPERTLLNIDLWEVSIVTFPANDKARVSSVKAVRQADEVLSSIEALTEKLVVAAFRR
jgi:phage head maturation protease